MPEANTTGREWDAARAGRAETRVKNLRCEAAALEGLAERAHTGERPSVLPIVQAGLDLLLAAADNLLEKIIDLPKIAPETRRFIEQLALHVADWTAIKIDYAVSDWGPKCHITGAGPERAGEAMSSTEEPEELLRAWFPMTDAELEQITHGGDAFSQGEVFKRGELPPIGKWETVAFFGRRSPREDPRFLYMTTVARCWRHLSSQHRAAQSPKAAIAYLTRPRRPEIGEI